MGGKSNSPYELDISALMPGSYAGWNNGQPQPSAPVQSAGAALETTPDVNTNMLGTSKPMNISLPNNGGGVVGGASSPGLFSSFLPTTYKASDGSSQTGGGWGSAAMSAIGTGVNAYLGFKGLDLAEETLDFQKDSWEKRFAMMQDQYYRKLNTRRSNHAVINGLGNVEDINNYYDSGSNLEGAYPGAQPSTPASQSGFAPTQENANMMNLAQSGSPVSPSGAYDMMNNPNSTITNVSNSGFTGSNIKNQVPVTSADAAMSNTQIGPQGKPKSKKKKKDVEKSDNSANDQT